jgi:hypothetical protein
VEAGKGTDIEYPAFKSKLTSTGLGNFTFSSVPSLAAVISFSRTTAKYSMSLFLIFSRPKWSTSSCSRAFVRKERSVMVDLGVAEEGQGMAVSHSIYVMHLSPGCGLNSGQH